MLRFCLKETLLSVHVVKVQVGGSDFMTGMRRNDAQLTKKGLIRLTVEELSLSPVHWTFLCKLLGVLLLIIPNDINQSEVLLGHRACRVLTFLLVERALNYSVLPPCLLHLLCAALADRMPTLQNKWLVIHILSCVILVAHRALEARVAPELLQVVLVHLRSL
jgi:hypothetical protein